MRDSFQHDKDLPLQHSLGHVDCKACEQLKKEIMRSGELGVLVFREVWPLWWELKSQEVSEKTARCYREYSRPLLAFFGDLKLSEIHIGNVVAYRSSRVTAGPQLINHEVSCLGQILESAGLWESIKRHYKPLRIPKSGPGQALVEEEALHLLEVASRKKKWECAYLGSLVSVNTTCGPGELQKLRLRDVDLGAVPPCINIVEGAKNDYRVRSIPLNSDAFWAMQRLLLIATEKGAALPEHYLFPHRAHVKGQPPDPTRPMGSWKKAWYALRREAAKKYPRLAGIRMYDMRHHAITSLLENPNISEQTIKDIAGHVSKKILERYSHIRLRRKMDALDALEGVGRKPPRLQLVPPKQSIQ